jgi:hypothetical protein
MLENLQSQVKMVEAYAAPYVNKLGNPQNGIEPPQESTISQESVVQQSNEQLSTINDLQNLPLPKQQEMLLKMYDEFAITDDGKALAANFSKFARFIQSKVAKQS